LTFVMRAEAVSKLCWGKGRPKPRSLRCHFRPKGSGYERNKWYDPNHQNYCKYNVGKRATIH